MKRFILCLAFATLAVGAQAQYSDLYYHRVGDTIVQNPNNGYFEYWEWDRLYEEELLTFVQWWSHFPVTLFRYYTPAPLKVLGIAASFTYLDNLLRPVTATPRQEYLYLYDADVSGVHKIGELPYNIADTHRYIELKYHMDYHAPYINDTTCCMSAPIDTVFPLYEYYFDSAITVTDSFYVGFSTNSRHFDHYSDDTMPYYLWYSNGAIPVQVECKYSGSWASHIICLSPYSTRLIATLPYLYNMDTVWRYDEVDVHFVVYPIVEMDTTLPPADMCADVGGVQASLSGDCLTVSWDSWPRYTSLQLRYGPISTAQSQWDTVEVSGSTYTICGVDTSQSHYGISLRAYCQSANDTTDWSHLIWVPMVQSSNAIDNAETLLAASVAVSPNPTTGTVSVVSQHRMQRIEVVNARGILVYSEPAYGHKTDVDLGILPPGAYIVSVQTAAGTTCKRLVKQ